MKNIEIEKTPFKYSSEIENHLNNKYNLSFAVATDEPYSYMDEYGYLVPAYCNETTFKDVLFKCGIDKSGNILGDYFINLQVADDFSSKLSLLIPEKNKVYSYVETPGNFFDGDKADFFDQMELYYVTSFVFIDDEAALPSVYEAVKSLEKEEYYHLSVIVFIAKNLDDNIEKSFYNQEYKYDYFIKDTNISSCYKLLIHKGVLDKEYSDFIHSYIKTGETNVD